MSILDRALRVGEGKKFKQFQKHVARIGDFEPELELESDEELRERYDRLRERAVNGDAPEPVFVSTLENEGVGLSDFHDYDDQIDQEVKDEIQALADAIIAGDITPSDYYGE